MKKKKEIRTEITITAPKEIIWQILMNNEEYESWNPFIVTSLGRIEIGNHIQNTIMNGDNSMEFSPRITGLQPGIRFEWLGHLWFPGIFDGRHYFELEELSENETKLIHGEKFKGLLSQIILNQIYDQTERGFIKMNLALKSLAESKAR